MTQPRFNPRHMEHFDIPRPKRSRTNNRIPISYYPHEYPAVFIPQPATYDQCHSMPYPPTYPPLHYDSPGYYPEHHRFVSPYPEYSPIQDIPFSRHPHYDDDYSLRYHHHPASYIPQMEHSPHYPGSSPSLSYTPTGSIYPEPAPLMEDICPYATYEPEGNPPTSSSEFSIPPTNFGSHSEMRSISVETIGRHADRASGDPNRIVRSLGFVSEERQEETYEYTEVANEYPTRSVLIFNLSPQFNTRLALSTLKQFGDVRECDDHLLVKRGILIVSYFDVRHAIQARKSMVKSGFFGSKVLTQFRHPLVRENRRCLPKDHQGSAIVTVLASRRSSVSTADLHRLLRGFGDIKCVREFGKTRNKYFVEFFDERDCNAAVEQAHGIYLKDCIIELEYCWDYPKELRSLAQIVALSKESKNLSLHQPENQPTARSLSPDKRNIKSSSSEIVCKNSQGFTTEATVFAQTVAHGVSDSDLAADATKSVEAEGNTSTSAAGNTSQSNHSIEVEDADILPEAAQQQQEISGDLDESQVSPTERTCIQHLASASMPQCFIAPTSDSKNFDVLKEVKADKNRCIKTAEKQPVILSPLMSRMSALLSLLQQRAKSNSSSPP